MHPCQAEMPLTCHGCLGDSHFRRISQHLQLHCTSQGVPLQLSNRTCAILATLQAVCVLGGKHIRGGLSEGFLGCAGIHAEQFRIWEALEVGALPVVLDEEQHSHLEQIGLKLPKVREIRCCPCVCWRVPLKQPHRLSLACLRCPCSASHST